MFPKSTFKLNARRGPSGSARIAGACSTAAIVSELFPAAKMATQKAGLCFDKIFYGWKAGGHLPELSGEHDTLITMAKLPFRSGYFDCPSDSLYFSLSFKQF
jgi:hypothetical protein